AAEARRFCMRIAMRRCTGANSTANTVAHSTAPKNGHTISTNAIDTAPSRRRNAFSWRWIIPPPIRGQDRNYSLQRDKDGGGYASEHGNDRRGAPGDEQRERDQHDRHVDRASHRARPYRIVERRAEKAHHR